MVGADRGWHRRAAAGDGSDADAGGARGPHRAVGIAPRDRRSGSGIHRASRFASPPRRAALVERRRPCRRELLLSLLSRPTPMMRRSILLFTALALGCTETPAHNTVSRAAISPHETDAAQVIALVTFARSWQRL